MTAHIMISARVYFDNIQKQYTLCVAAARRNRSNNRIIGIITIAERRELKSPRSFEMHRPRATR